MRFIGEEENRILVFGVEYLPQAVAFLEALFVISLKRFKRYLFKISLLGKDYLAGIIFDGVIINVFLDRICVDYLRTSRLTVFFLDFRELLCDKCFELIFIFKNLLNLRNFCLEIFNLGNSVDNILTVEVAKLDFGNVIRLNLVN